MRAAVILSFVIFISGAGGVVAFDGGGGDIALEPQSTTETYADGPGQAATATHSVSSVDGETGSQTNHSHDELTIHHLDVGQADSTLLVTPQNKTILIDTGDWRQSGEEVIAYLEAHDIDRIDHLVATHAHADHIGGHAEVIAWAEKEGDGIGAAYDSGVAHDTATYESYLDAIEEYEVDLFLVEEGDALPLESENLTNEILNPAAGESGTDLHYNSVTIVFEFGNVSYVTTGDAERDAEHRMLAEWEENLSGDAYQAGHHGSNTSSTQSFLEAIGPEIAVISSALDSPYGHPHDDVLERFAAHDIETYWTGVHGDIVMTTDGSDLTVQPAETYSTDPLDLKDAKPNNDESVVTSRTGIDGLGYRVAV